MSAYWSWILEAVSFTGLFLVGKKFWWAWLILIGNTALWGIYGVSSHQYGFLVASCFYAPMYFKNLWQWFHSRHNPITEKPILTHPE